MEQEGPVKKEPADIPAEVHRVGRALSDLTQRDGIDLAAVEALEALLDLIGHEFRTLFAIIHGSSRLLANEPDPFDERRVLAETIFRTADLGLLMLDTLADVRAVDRGELTLDRQVVDVEEVVRTVAADLREALLGDRQVEFHRHGDAPLAASIDVRRIRQIVFNVFTNAAMNTPPVATLNITFRRRDRRIEVEFRDHGHGIAPTDSDLLFEKFTVIEAGRQAAGTGLYVSRGIARAHGGDLRAEPAPEEGGIFILTLPAA